MAATLSTATMIARRDLTADLMTLPRRARFPDHGRRSAGYL
jgi:hypothetical protein